MIVATLTVSLSLKPILYSLAAIVVGLACCRQAALFMNEVDRV